MSARNTKAGFRPVGGLSLEAPNRTFKKTLVAKTGASIRRSTLPRTYLLALGWIGAVLSLSPIPVQSRDLDIRHYGAADGLPISGVRALDQGPDGRLWIAGSFGILSFDGRQSQALPIQPNIEAGQAFLERDADGSLWSMAAQTPFSVFQHAPSGTTALPLVAPGSNDAVLVDFAVVGSAPTEVALATTDGLLLWRSPDWLRLTTADGLPHDRIRALTDWGGRLVAGGPAGLALIRSGFVDRTLDQRLRLAPSQNILALAVEGDGPDESLWLVGDSWIGLLTESDFEVLGTALELGSLGSQGFGLIAAPDGLGGLYLAEGYEVSYFHPSRGLERWIESARAGPIRSLLVDRESSIWLAGDNGLSRVSNRRFESFTATSDGLFDDTVFSLLERRNGTVVLGHRGGLSFIGSGAEVVVELLPLATPDRHLEVVRDLAETPDGRLWLAAGSLGIRNWDGLLSSPIQGLDSEDEARHLEVEESTGDLWVATQEELWRQPAGESGLVAISGRLPLSKVEGPAITGLKAGTQGMWVLTRTGLSFLHSETPGCDRHWSLEPSLEPSLGSATGTTLLDVSPPTQPGPDQTIWLATSNGLYRAMDSGLLEPFSPLGVRDALRFVIREGRYLWMGSEKALYRFQPGDSELGEGAALEPWSEFHRIGAGGAIRDVLGRLWVSTGAGVSVFDRYREPIQRQPPIPELLTMASGDRVWSLAESHRLPAGIDQLVFRFSVGSLLDPDQILLSSRLEGFDDGWSDPFGAETLEMRYFDLPPGEYRFQLRAMSAIGGWSAVVTSEPVELVGPFWQQTWFFGALGLVVLVGLFVLQTVVTQRRHSLLLEEEVAQRVAELQASEDRYQKTFKTIEDGVVTTDERGRLALMNPRAQELTGWSEPDAIGEGIDKILRLFQIGVGDQVGAPVSLLSNELQDTIGPTQTAILESRTGMRRTVELTASPIVSRGVGFAGLVFTFRDISRKREVEAELARAHKLEAIGLLAGGIAHDFNNLLMVIMGSLSLVLETTKFEDQQRRVLSDAETALVRARDLTQQLLTFSRGGAPVREAASIAEVIQDSATFVLRGSKVSCQIDLAEDLFVVDIDAGQISQVLNNLLINAVQAMADGGTVRIVGRNLVEQAPHPLRSGPYISIAVIDSGMGIPEHLVHRIFDPYFSTKQEGRGLGLASAYSIAKSHDGLLTVQSELGEGATFTLYLPASEAVESPKNETVEAVTTELTGKVLVMDDDPVVRRTTGVMLEKLGFDVTFAVDGHQALNLFARHMEAEDPFRLVLMDLTVPGGMGGQEAVQYILQLEPNALAVVYSGYSNDPVLANYQDYGFRGRLSKPFRLQDLQAVLSDVMISAEADSHN